MKHEDKTKQQLINELVEMQKRITESEKLKIQCKRAEEALRESKRRYRTLLENLPPRERRVLPLIAEGKTMKGIASHFYVGVKTAETHRRHIMNKLSDIFVGL